MSKPVRTSDRVSSLEEDDPIRAMNAAVVLGLAVKSSYAIELFGACESNAHLLMPLPNG